MQVFVRSMGRACCVELSSTFLSQEHICLAVLCAEMGSAVESLCWVVSPCGLYYKTSGSSNNFILLPSFSVLNKGNCFILKLKTDNNPVN